MKPSKQRDSRDNQGAQVVEDESVIDRRCACHALPRSMRPCQLCTKHGGPVFIDLGGDDVG